MLHLTEEGGDGQDWLLLLLLLLLSQRKGLGVFLL
jgi:hypothetical protein